MGTGRTLPALAQRYGDMQASATPTQSVSTLETWSAKFEWAERSAEYDADYEAIKTAEREAVMNYGAALDFDRVSRLKRLADFLEAQLFERGEDGDYHNVWLPDVKQIGSGADAERVDLERFNASLLAEYRNVLADIASEVGGRKQKVEHAGNPDSPITFKVIYPDDE